MGSNYFEVCESRSLNFFIGCIFLALLIGVVAMLHSDDTGKVNDFLFLYIFLSFGSIFFFIKGLRKRRIIVISQDGISHNGLTICNWSNFLNAYIGQEFPNVTSNSDGLSDVNCILVVYFDSKKSSNYVYKIKMSGTESKSEYEIIDAIQYFSGQTLSKEVYSI